MKPSYLIFLLFLLTVSLPAFAQTADNAQVSERMDRLEHDLQLLQRQLATGVPASGGSVPTAPSDASLGVRLDEIEEQLRNLRGKVEENENQVHKVSEAIDKLQHDTDFRFNELAKAPPAATSGKSNDKEKLAVSVPPTPDGDNVDADGSKSDFATPRDHYNYAFRLLNQTQYPEAAAAFDSFVKKYPKDPLVGNAYYWEGETYYIRRDYVNAADNFRQGFEALPQGPKAADNLFKLAMSLDAMSRDKDACVVLQQVVAKFKKSAITQRADQEQKRIGCK